MEEPRLRLDAATYGGLARRWGPFTDWLGAERRHEQPRDGGGGLETRGQRLWLHPSHSTVGSALRLIGERLGEQGAKQARGVVVVPHEEGAAWWSLTRHFEIVGRLPAGGRHLEANRLGRWEEVTSQRDALILAFPRAEAAASEHEARQSLRAALQAGTAETTSPSRELELARQSAAEAAAARTQVTSAARGRRADEQRQLRPDRALLRGSDTQRCHYRGVRCMQCGGFFRRGEMVRSLGAGQAHTSGTCQPVTGEAPSIAASPATAAPDVAQTAQAYSVLVRLEREFALGGTAGGGVLLPRHSQQHFRRFVRWLAADEGRRRHLTDVRLAIGSYLCETQLTDWSEVLDEAILEQGRRRRRRIR